MKIIEFLRDHNIPHITEGHHHCVEGWVQIHCPFCGGSGNWHMGIPIQGGLSGSCWRGHNNNLTEVIRVLLGCGWGKAKQVREDYGGGGRKRLAKKQIQYAEKVEWPTGCHDMTDRHKKYLEDRDFDPDYIEEEWGVRGTNHIGEYKHRIIIPIHTDGVLVSFQGRDITGRSEARYLPCVQEKEVLHYKHTLYGVDKVIEAGLDTIVIVEGVTDVWRLGVGAVSTFGTKYTQLQFEMMKRFTKRIILFDSEPQAVRQADTLLSALAAFGDPEDTESFTLEDGDPADSSQEEADQFMREVLA